MKKSFAIAIVVFCLAAVSCNRYSGRYMPNISGKAGEIQVVCSKPNWEGDPGIAVRSVLGGDFPFLPQVEPYYVLFNVPPTSFSDVFKVHRNILYLDIDPSIKDTKFELKQDVWAAPQTVVQITAANPDSLTHCIVFNKDRLLNIFDQAERMRVIDNAKKYENVEIRTKLAQVFGGSPYFPNEYSIKKLTDNFAWISYETTYTNQSVLMYKVPYLDSLWAQPGKIIEQMDTTLKQQVPGMRDGSYMTISRLTPGYKWVRLGNKRFAELRGLWEVQNDYMGGPFVSHSFISNDGHYVITLIAFVYAPKYDKRNYLRQVESIIYSFQWADEFKPKATKK
jgi:hypothetical protein